MAAALKRATGREPTIVWHGETDASAVDLIVLPGGFSFGDYLRSGAIAARSPIMPEVVKRAAATACSCSASATAFRRSARSGLLPGVLMRNASLKFVCREVKLEVVNTQTPFTRAYRPRQVIRCPVAHRRRQLLRRRGDARPAGGRGPRRLPLCRRHQSERLAPRYRRHPERGRQRARPDAASGGSDGRGARRPRRPAALRGARRRLHGEGCIDARLRLLTADRAGARGLPERCPRTTSSSTPAGPGRRPPGASPTRSAPAGSTASAGLRGLFLRAGAHLLSNRPRVLIVPKEEPHGLPPLVVEVLGGEARHRRAALRPADGDRRSARSRSARDVQSAGRGASCRAHAPQCSGGICSFAHSFPATSMRHGSQAHVVSRRRAIDRLLRGLLGQPSARTAAAPR